MGAKQQDHSYQEGSMRTMRAFAAAVVLFLLLFGVPWLLYQWGAWAEFLELVHTPSLIMMPDDGHLILAVLTIVGTGAWLFLAWGILAEIAEAISIRHQTKRGKHPRRAQDHSPTTGPVNLVRGLVRPLVSAVFALAVAGGSLQAQAQEPAAVVPVSAEAWAYRPASGTLDDTVQYAETGLCGETSVHPGAWVQAGTKLLADPNAPNTDVGDGLYVVGPGDSLWSIAEKVFGDGSQWARIAKYNEDQVTGTGDLIHVGWTLKIPPPEDADTCEPDHTVTVAAGDSLWSLAQQDLGDPTLWPTIAAANPNLISDPNLIQTGWELTIPCEASSEAATLSEADESSGPQTSETGGADSSGANANGADQGLILDPSENTPLVPSESSAAGSGSSGSEIFPNLPGVSSQSAGAQMSSVPGEEPLSPGGVIPSDAVSTMPNDSTDDPSEYVNTTGPAQTQVSGSGQTVPEPEVSVSAIPENNSVTASEYQALHVPGSAVGLSTILAGGMVLMLGRRRLTQLRARPLGRRIIQPSDEGKRLEAALAVIGNREDEVHRADSGENDETGVGIVAISEAGEDTTLRWIPDGEMKVWVGEDDKGRIVAADTSGGKPFLICAPQIEDAVSVIRAVTMGMAVEEFSAGVELHVITEDDLFDTFDNLDLHRSFTDGISSLAEALADRRNYVGQDQWETLRSDPNCGEAWRPIMFCFADPVTEAQFCDLAETLEGSDVGVGALVVMDFDNHEQALPMVSGCLEMDAPGFWVLNPGQVHLRPLTLTESPALSDLLTTTASQATTPAWWVHPDTLDRDFEPVTLIERSPEMTTVPRQPDDAGLTAVFSHPTLKMLGPIILEGAQGIPPSRAERSCMEYCGWLLEHPGTTAVAMAQGLMVAEGTRRSNMSRLRSWLGQDPSGNPYLPEAYSGRIWLDPGVGSDWQRLSLLIAGGVEITPTDMLIQALQLVRGAPLADAAPGQWHWAEEMRTDMVSLIRDIGVIATRRSLNEGNIDQARWAASRALVAAPEDELLLCSRVMTEHAAGNRMEVERLVTWIARNARNLGIDMLPDTIAILQEVIGTSAPLPHLPRTRDHAEVDQV